MEVERRVGRGLRVERPSPGSGRKAHRSRGTGAAVDAGGDRHRRGSGANRAGRAPGRHRRFGAKGSAARRRRQRAALPFAEVNREVGVGQLRQVVEAGGQPAAGRIGVDPARHLDEDPTLGVLGDQVEGQQRVERVVAGSGDEQCTLDWRFEERAANREVADLRGVGAAGARRRRSRLGFVLVRSADGEPGTDGRIDRHPFGQPHDRLADRRGNPPGGREQAPGVDFEAVFEAARRRRAGVDQENVGFRFEGKPRAALEARSDGFTGDHGRGVLPRVGTEREDGRIFAVGRERQVGDRGVGFGRADRAFRPAEGGLGLIQAVAPLGVVENAPGRPPQFQCEPVQVDQLGDVAGDEGEPVPAVGLADARDEGDRPAVRIEPDLRRGSGRRLEVEDSEGAGSTAAEGGPDVDDADL